MTATVMGVRGAPTAGEAAAASAPHTMAGGNPDWIPLITIRHLLTHTAGLRTAWNGTLIEDWPVEGEAALEDWLTSPEFAGTRIFATPPGELHIDSGVDAAIMAWVVQRVSGELFADYMRAHVLDPLGMTRTTFRPEEAVADGDFTVGLVGGPRGWPNPWDDPLIAWTSVPDMARLAQFFLHGDAAVLSADLFEEAMSPQPDAEWGIARAGLMNEMSDALCYPGACPSQVDLRAHFAGGNGIGWQSAMVVIPERDVAVVELVNATSQYPRQCELAAVLEVLDLPSLEPAAPADDYDPNVYVGRYALDSGFGTTRITLEETGNLRLSSPSCILEPAASGFFHCQGEQIDVAFWFDAEGRAEYVSAGIWIATRIDDGQ
jgi:CubicO group peptidase (beta-lactamase class C family)